ncbi:MAG TPA: MerR family transcriptional regulator [Candidatus Dormibacteraeota bacterium]|jgi:MerR family transcriptional regulator/heat shock protein HspR|nr:MerR family transcriptional regulator [Candidatus Dormibacteraeota bacterium]
MSARMAAATPSSSSSAPGLDLDKPVYTISVASEILETHPRTLMMYENLGLISPWRTSTNRRRFSQRDIIRLQVIQTLTRKHGVNLAGVRHILSLLEQLHRHGVEAPANLAAVMEKYQTTL